MTMENKTLIIAAVIIVATAAMAMGPLVSVVNAAPNGDVRCVHNGNGDDKCTGGKSTTECVKTKGKYVCDR
jgi:hypothetical protein